ncbi:MAG: hypothetical protein ACI8XO_002292 [Verrucomicrobiales bacterium]|jgi:hypothetical protein
MTQIKIVPLSIVLWLAAGVFAQSAPATDPDITSVDLEPRVIVKTARFSSISAKHSGVDVTYPIDLQSPHKHLYVSGFACGGVAAGDLDGDRKPDLFFAGAGGKNRLFLNRGDFRFEEKTSAVTAGEDRWGSAVALVDIDNDGDLDAYLSNYDSPNQLFINDGKANFTEAAAAFGLDLVDASLAAAFCDYDRDGDLDVYLLNNRFYSATGFPSPEPKTLSAEQQKYFRFEKTKSGQQLLNIVPRTDRLLRNDGGKFTDVSKAAGIAADPRHGLAATWWDYDKDGKPDLYVSNDFDDPDALYHNNGDGTFSDVTSKVLPHTAWFSMGADSADINNDGWPDLLAADMSGTTHFKDKTTMGAMGSRIWVTQTEPRQYMRNALYLGTGTGRMMEAAHLAGLADSDWTWAVKFADFDCDGRDDLFLSNGMTRNFNNSDSPFSRKMFVGKSEWDPYEKTPARKEQNLAFQNLGDLQFDNVSKLWGLDHEGISFASATADFDLDGDPDLVVVNMDEPVALYRNDINTGNRISIRLVGRDSNRFGIGARIELVDGRRKQHRWIRPLSGFKSGDEPVAHFGIGDQKQVKVDVTWPSGRWQGIDTLLDAGKCYTITEAGRIIPEGIIGAEPTQFSENPALKKAIHREQEFDDFQFQSLLPNQLSRLGPGSAWGDIDGDGDDDFFLGGACGFMGQLHLNNGDGTFRESKLWTLADEDRGCEDTAVLFFDADGDEDLDLFIASGGVEAPPGHPIYTDRLFLNDGRGFFTKSLGAIPGEPVSSGAACAADYNKDGAIDLFVGGRVVPGQYPTAPRNRLLINDGKGKFRDDIDPAAPSLRFTGMVTSALWSDVNGSGRLDLLVTHEWGPVMVFMNLDGVRLMRVSGKDSLDHLTGWWNGIAGGDFDNDGDIDYAVTNFGLNTKYHASPEKPALLYYGDLDGSGKKRIIEAEFEGGICYPIRGKSCSTHAIPSLAKKFPSYNDFALAKLDDIYTQQQLDAAQKFEAKELRSGVLLNDGRGKFEFKPLPHLAQIAPGFGIVAGEFDGDGNTDLAIAQNFFSPQPETGRMDGGLSMVLHGNGDGTFKTIAPRQSGIAVAGDGASITLADTDNNGAPDIAIGVNSEAVRSYQNRGKNILAVRLLQAPGTRITLDGQSAEYYGGSGYLSQSAPVLFFASPNKATKLTARWPDGKTTTHEVKAGTTKLTLPAP